MAAQRANPDRSALTPQPELYTLGSTHKPRLEREKEEERGTHISSTLTARSCRLGPIGFPVIPSALIPTQPPRSTGIKVYPHFADEKTKAQVAAVTNLLMRLVIRLGAWAFTATLTLHYTIKISIKRPRPPPSKEGRAGARHEKEQSWALPSTLFTVSS